MLPYYYFAEPGPALPYLANVRFDRLLVAIVHRDEAAEVFEDINPLHISRLTSEGRLL